MSVEVHSDKFQGVLQYKPFILIKCFNHNLLFSDDSMPQETYPDYCQSGFSSTDYVNVVDLSYDKRFAKN